MSVCSSCGEGTGVAVVVMVGMGVGDGVSDSVVEGTGVSEGVSEGVGEGVGASEAEGVGLIVGSEMLPPQPVLAPMSARKHQTGKRLPLVISTALNILLPPLHTLPALASL